VTAIACHNDMTAIGACAHCARQAQRVPAEVSVIGCDDIAAASWVVPALTTVARQKAEMGWIAVERLAPPSTTRSTRVETIRLPMALRDAVHGPAPAAREQAIPVRSAPATRLDVDTTATSAPGPEE
jgi:DNA-binding LacI/PurR family transcriptional regulator